MVPAIHIIKKYTYLYIIKNSIGNLELVDVVKCIQNININF